jgi:hypothetical protein
VPGINIKSVACVKVILHRHGVVFNFGTGA